MKIKVDRSICAGHAICAINVPDLFTIDDEGYSTANGVIVPPEREEDAFLGFNSCPERAITLEE